MSTASPFADLPAAFRHLRRASGFALLASALLATGIGAVTLVYSAARGIVLRPLPYAQPERLVGLQAVNLAKSIVQPAISSSDFRDLHERRQSLVSFGAFRPDFATWKRPGEQPVQLVAALVTEEFFATLGVSPLLGRVFSADEFSASAPRGVVLSHAAWVRRFDADPAVLGRAIVLNDEPCAVLGVMPPTVREPAFVDVWLPFPAESPEYFARDSRYWSALGRLAPEASVGRAQAELGAIAADLARQHPATNRDWTVRVVPLHELRVGGVRQSLWLLLGATGLLLLVACFNLANLLLARGLRRLDEMALRQALGATAERLRRQVLWENLLVGLAGGIGGVGLAFGAVRLFVNHIPPALLPRANEVSVDGGVLAVAVLVSVAAGLVAGLLPAWQAGRSSVGALLKEGGVRSGPGAGTRFWQRALVVAQLAVTFVVLAGAALLGRSLWRLQSVELGFRSEDVHTLRAAPSPSQYDSNADLARYFERLVEAARGVPGIEAAAVDCSAPLTGITLRFPYRVAGESAETTGSSDAVFNATTCGLRDALRLQLVAGRWLDDHDDENGAAVVVINETLARRLAPTGPVLGRRLTLVPWLSQKPHEVVGVIRDVRQENLGDAPPAQLYVPQRQAPWFFSTLVVRAAAGRPFPAAALRRALQDADAGLAGEFRAHADSIAATAMQPRLLTGLFVGLGAVALGLTLFGVYASLRFAVAQRTREFGLRLALGAAPAGIVGLVTSEVARLVLAGLLLGLAGAFGLGLALRSQLYGVTAHDPVLLIATAALLAVAALVAALGPAVGAARLPPAEALRHV